ncbi:CRISPR-associated endonuclease Cas2 [Maledivibacter halophilus]|uniref:CRISPR-associated endoribonuclease Cas2 n=1 Tax=Maledivibacter halophilus TaxID=36842 RepID=A0A1T5MQ93_9FIRM|nr:CRISPR-associated endonuclease Cas2 [Maledivibacter halophilus]SKC90407.1 CRISPR-associated protein Cas2 [Maledivibacter halophilus]
MSIKAEYISMILYDLPTKKKEDLKIYRKFRKLLLVNGYYKLQESVYFKRFKEKQQAKSSMKLIKDNRPSKGDVRGIILTSKVFKSMECIVGNFKVEEKLLLGEKIIEI